MTWQCVSVKLDFSSVTLARLSNVKENIRQGTNSERRREMEKGRRERKVQSEKFDKERRKFLGSPAWIKARRGGDTSRCVATKRREKVFEGNISKENFNGQTHEGV